MAAGAVALISLACCLAWPLYLFARGIEGFDARFTTFKLWLIVPTLLYFISGTLYVIQREKREGAA